MHNLPNLLKKRAISLSPNKALTRRTGQRMCPQSFCSLVLCCSFRLLQDSPQTIGGLGWRELTGAIQTAQIAISRVETIIRLFISPSKTLEPMRRGRDDRCQPRHNLSWRHATKETAGMPGMAMSLPLMAIIMPIPGRAHSLWNTHQKTVMLAWRRLAALGQTITAFMILSEMFGSGLPIGTTPNTTQLTP